jgi:small-conductance mechanosensitive channel
VIDIETNTIIDEMPYFWEILLSLVTWVVALVFIRYNRRLFTRLDQELATFNVEDRSIKAIDQMLDLVTVVVAVFVTLYIWGVDEMLYAALTTVGVIGLMLAFAIQDIASNFISGILLIMSKDLLIGDSIEVDGIEGKIEKITVRTTSVRRYDGALAIVPNSKILNEPVVDFSATEKRRVEVKVVLPSTVDIQTASEALREAADREARRLADEPTDVLLKGFEASIMTLELRFWVARVDFIDVKSEVHGGIQTALSERGIPLDVPTSIDILGGQAQPGQPSGNL